MLCFRHLISWWRPLIAAILILAFVFTFFFFTLYVFVVVLFDIYLFIYLFIYVSVYLIHLFVYLHNICFPYFISSFASLGPMLLGLVFFLSLLTSCTVALFNFACRFFFTHYLVYVCVIFVKVHEERENKQTFRIHVTILFNNQASDSSSRGALQN